MRGDGIPDVPVSHAMLDAEGRLVAADPAIMALNDHAGGALGTPLAVPQLATVVRLARRLGVLVSRAVTVGDDDADIDLWVRVQPDGAGTRLTVSGWRELRPRIVATPRAAVIETGDLCWETDAALRLTFVSIEAARRIGVDALALLGRPLTMLFALDEAGEGALPILEAVARRTPLHDQPARLRANDMAVSLTARIKRDAAGEFAGLDGVARAADAPPAPRPVSMAPGFTDGLDRALRAPLARIIAHADTIHAEAEGPVQRDYIDYASDIANAGRHLLGLVDDLVDLQAVEGPDFAVEAEPIDLADVARRAAGLLSVRAANAGVAIARPLPELRIPTTGDFRRALQIMVNLIGNAVRYTPEGGVVTVTAAQAGDRVVAIVADQGKGIAPADQARIFDKFERVDPSEAGGNGLGLYIARRLAEAMGGALTVESVPGEGARFTLTLPA
ncbi:HAMP domain-containing histidine kinase [Sphingomonas sp. A2-49]|uniref:sensor histidine kinase n=1 Tax=Sphingomonas sp. A2-49 TaxID=1391375 RepID=UPI0021D206F6|nr:HAMP domain-containing sensor histidine kinase [Sphingomonas sp. A2-49]MCU6452557.1 HAMP domain-containing histidine kinase [Sphingomonas sp. A2-49]